MNDEDLARELTVLHSDTATKIDAATIEPSGMAGRAMTDLIPVTLEHTFADLTRALDAMREAGFITTTPATPTDDVTAPRNQRLTNPRTVFHPINEETQ
ncbi:hypothetical protein ACFWPK_14790 [Nocardia sp. NPDC058519]|uniref:hypothetical protein n=1 Tax=Nocardia sp. NPDC058519 TaxID=3346535 RepID=UPI0036475DD3